MAITDYASLQAAVADWVERSDLTARLPTFVANAEAKVNRVLRERRSQAQDTASVDTALTALPTDFLEAITVEARLSSSEDWVRLEPAPVAVLVVVEGGPTSTGRPRYWSLLGPQLMLYPTPDQAYSVKITYFTKLPALSDSNTTNWLLTDAPDVYFDGALAGFYEFDRDFEAANRYLQKFETGLAELMAMRRTPVGRLRTDVGLLQRSTRNAGYSIYSDS